MKLDDQDINRAFRAALSMGYALQGRPDPLGFHEVGQPKKADRPGSVDKLRDAVQSVKAARGLCGDTPEQLEKSVDVNIGHAWMRTALKKIIQALSLIQKYDPAADLLALELLGQAAWERQGAEPEAYSEREIKDVWPTRPSSADSLNM